MNSNSAVLSSYDVESVRSNFPILQVRPYGKSLVYLDNAATTQKPRCVLDAMYEYYTTTHSNVHRGIYYLSERATNAYEYARDVVRRFINAQHREEIVFTRGTTESINLVASAWGRVNLHTGDEILLTVLEHHSNIVPWQLIAEQTGARLRVVSLDANQSVSAETVCQAITERTKIVAIAHVSNVLGIMLPVEPVIECAHAIGAVVLLDGAQAVAHHPVDVQQLDCDFYAFSSHKVYGPTGIGVLYGKRKFFEAMPPYQAGGDMIRNVTFERTLYNDLPYKFEAGTPPIAEAIGLAAALEYLQQIGLQTIATWETVLIEHCIEQLSTLEGVHLLGPSNGHTSVVSFVIEGVHPHDLATMLDREGIAVRAGHHCAQPLMDYFGIPAATRISVGMYNTLEEIDRTLAVLQRSITLLR